MSVRPLGLVLAVATVVASLGAAANTAGAATLYVDNTLTVASCTTYDPAARACGRGTATAYPHIQDTFPMAAAGDTVLIRGGMYTAEAGYRVPSNSGRAGAPITFRGYEREAVHVHGALAARTADSTASSPFDLSGRSFIAIEGLEISGHGIAVRLIGSSDITVRSMNLHDCGIGVWIGSGSARVQVSDVDSTRNGFRDGGATIELRGATDVRVERVTANANSGDPAVGAVEGDGFHVDDPGNARVTFVDCVANDNEDDGFDITGDAVRLERCTAARNIVGFKLWDEHCDPSSCPATPTVNSYTLLNVRAWANTETGLFAQNGPNVEIYNSVFANNTYEGVRLAQNRAAFPDPPARAVMQNDVVTGNGRIGRRFDDAGADNTDWVLTSDHNVFFGNGAGNAVWSGEDASTLRVDPLFRAAAMGDFHLLAASPAIDSGRDLSALFTTDADGASRPAGRGWDRGAYEYGAGASDGGAPFDASPDGAPGALDGASDVDAAGQGGRDGGAGDAQLADRAGDAAGSGARAGCGCRAAGGGGFGAGTIALAAVALGAASLARRRRGAAHRRARPAQTPAV